MSDLITAMRSGKILLMDGAMGTEIQRRTGASALECCERYNRDDPELIRSIHQSYLDAGADVLLTNTFQANPIALARHGLESEFSDLWQSAINLAHPDHSRPYFVLADVGPIDGLTAQLATNVLDEAFGLDGVLLETWSSIDGMRRFADRVGTTLLVSFTYCRAKDVMTVNGASPEDCAEAAQRCGVAALGVNCGKEIGMADMVEIVQRYRRACDLPLFVRPNAGSPGKSARRYPRTPDTMAAALPALLDVGVAMVGGCCGTTPEHIRTFRTVIDEYQTSRIKGKSSGES